MELQNLESHLILDQRMAKLDSSKRGKDRKNVVKKTNFETQTDVTLNKMMERERDLELRESENQIERFKMKQQLDTRERELLRKERELEF